MRSAVAELLPQKEEEMTSLFNIKSNYNNFFIEQNS
ncbi:MAG: hypothetical protein ACI857_003137 [Arenicella sp.]|jgi:hypothetical protein